MGDEGKGRETQDNNNNNNVQAMTGGKGNEKEAQVMSTTSLGPEVGFFFQVSFFFFY